MDAPVCDLVLLSWNHLEETQPCLESLFEHTTVPCRLFIVDNGSEPPVRAFLASVAPRGSIQEVHLLQHETNEGFPKGMNRGIRASRAPFVCLLNNDLRVTTGWLEELIDVARADPRIGVVNPTSSTFGNSPPRGVSLEDYARQLKRFHLEYTEVGMCIGFCMLITREVLDRIGPLSEEVERIFFEDEDFSMRAQHAGYQCVVAAGCYVYHAEHKTVRKMPEREALFARNRRWCEERWGRRIRIAWPRFQPLVPGSEEARRWLGRVLAWARRRTHVYVYYATPARACVNSSLVSAKTQNPAKTQKGLIGSLCAFADLLRFRGDKAGGEIGTSEKEALFRSVGLVPHADIHWYPVPQAIAPLASLGRIVQRQKKPFDLIVAPESRWAALAHRLRWLHHADVVPEADEHTLTARWKHKSRSPLSS